MKKCRNVKECVTTILMVMLLMMLCLTGTGVAAYAGDRSVANPRKGENSEDTTYDCVWFGRYPQSDRSGRRYDPIKWRVLSVSGDDLFLMADRVLDCRQFSTYIKDDNECDVEVTWKNSDVREWLNDDFIKKAFTAKERKAIKTTEVKTRLHKESKLYSKSRKTITTHDKVYLLSAYETKIAKYRLNGSGYPMERKGTMYAKGRGLTLYNTVDGYGFSEWWLRDTGYYVNNASYVGSGGWMYDFHNERAAAANIGICPVIHIKKSSTLWKYAGTVKADNTAKEKNKPASVVKPGWVKRNGHYVYLDSRGKKVKKSAGWYKINDGYIKLSSSGARLNTKAGWYKVGDRYYYLNKAGERIVKGAGWYAVGRRYYYIRRDGSRAKRPSGWYKFGDYYYYIKDNGVRVKKTGWNKIGSRYYDINSDGSVAEHSQGWYKVGNRMYYISKYGKRIPKKTCWVDDWRGTYYVRSDGSLCHGWKRIGGKKYYFDRGGKLAGEGVSYSSKYNTSLLRFKKGGITWYQMKGRGVWKEQGASMFAKAKKKYPNGYVFDGIDRPDLNQCDIFAYAVAQMNTGTYPRDDWDKTYDINALKVGDIIKYSSGEDMVHFVTVTGIYGDCIQYMDANGAGNWSWTDGYRYLGKNHVKWDQWTTKSQLKQVFIFALVKP